MPTNMVAASTTQLRFTDRAFLFSIVVGPAAAYSILYLFHIILAAKLLRLLFRPSTPLSLPRPIVGDVIFLVFFLLWYLASLAWVTNLNYGLRYCAYIIIAVLTVIFTRSICRDVPKLAKSVRVVGVLVCFEMFLTILEALQLIRLPFSPYSPHQIYFGRTPTDLSLFSIEDVEYIIALPTGFFGNPNNLSAFLILVLPFFLLHPRRPLRFGGAAAILFIVFMAGSKIALLAYFLTLLLTIIFFSRWWLKLVSAATAVLIISLFSPLTDAMQNSSYKRLVQAGHIAQGVTRIVGKVFLEEEHETGGSIDVRAELLLNGYNALVETAGLGVGAGGSQTVQEEASERAGNIGSMHNFWFEVAVDGGVALGLAFALWYISILWRLRRVARRSQKNHPELQYYASSLFLGLSAFVLAGIGPSSVIYMLPLWMTVGASLAVIAIASPERITGELKNEMQGSLA